MVSCLSVDLWRRTKYVAPQDAYPKAKKLARKALELDGNLAVGHAALGFVLCYSDWDWPAAEAEFKRANELEPNGEVGHSAYALYLADMGRREEAIAEIKKSLEVDPLSVAGSVESWMVLLDGRQVGRGYRSIPEDSGDSSRLSGCTSGCTWGCGSYS